MKSLPKDKQMIIFSDIDGTLTDYDDSLSLSTIEAVKMLKKNGHRLYFCTGRTKAEMTSEVLALPYDGLIASNGAYIEDERELIYQCCFNEELSKELLSFLDERGYAYYLASNQGLFASKNYYEKELNKATVLYDKQINRISVLVNEETDLPAIKANFPQLILREREDGYHNYCDLHISGYSKRTAVEEIIRRNHFALEETIAIGDGMIDIPLFQLCHFAIAMGEAYDEVKKEADYVTANVRNNGYYSAFKNLGLI